MRLRGDTVLGEGRVDGFERVLSLEWGRLEGGISQGHCIIQTMDCILKFAL